MQEAWVQSLGWEDPLENERATYSSILAWRIPWTVYGIAKSQTRLSNFHFTSETDCPPESVIAAMLLQQWIEKSWSLQLQPGEERDK